MRTYNLKSKSNTNNYSIIIGKNILNILPLKIRELCPRTQKIALIIDSNIPNNFQKKIKNHLKQYEIFYFKFNASEKNKSIQITNLILEKLLSKNFNRSDVILGIGGGITGDVAGFISSIYKRGINFINIPTTLLAQVDSSIGGKTGVNAKYGKNLIGSFYQPKLVLSDVNFLTSLPKREMVCGYAEILKHAIIKDKKFFNWLKYNTDNILIKRNLTSLIFSIHKSCKIKLSFVNKDVNEKKSRMILNFGHTFAHAIEGINKYSKKINHGEAVLIGMVLATKFSVKKKICSKNTLNEILSIYKKNNLNFNLYNSNKIKNYKKIIYFMKNDKKNNDKKINFILLKKIGKTTLPNQFKFSVEQLTKEFNNIN